MGCTRLFCARKHYAAGVVVSLMLWSPLLVCRLKFSRNEHENLFKRTLRRTFGPPECFCALPSACLLSSQLVHRNPKDTGTRGVRATDTRLQMNVCFISNQNFGYFLAKPRNLLSREDSPFHAPKVALATEPPSTHSRRPPSAPKSNPKGCLQKQKLCRKTAHRKY